MAPSLGFTPRTNILSWKAHEWQQRVFRVKFSCSVAVSSLLAKHFCHSVGFAVSCSLHLVEFSLAPGTTLHEKRQADISLFLVFMDPV